MAAHPKDGRAHRANRRVSRANERTRKERSADIGNCFRPWRKRPAAADLRNDTSRCEPLSASLPVSDCLRTPSPQLGVVDVHSLGCWSSPSPRLRGAGERYAKKLSRRGRTGSRGERLCELEAGTVVARDKAELRVLLCVTFVKPAFSFGTTSTLPPPVHFHTYSQHVTTSIISLSFGVA